MIAFVVHISWDWDWDMAAIGTVFFLFAATCSSYLATTASDQRRFKARLAARAAADEARRREEAALAVDGVVADGQEAAGTALLLAPAADAASPWSSWRQLRLRRGRQRLTPAASAPSEPAVPEQTEPAVPEDTEPPVPATTESPATGEAAPRRRRRTAWPLRTVATVALVLLAVSWLVPYLSWREESAALDASGIGDSALALRHARSAARLDPLAVDPLITQSLVLEQLGRNGEALAVLRKAERLQPDNYQVHYHEGVLLLRAFGRKKAAIAALRRALALNPLDADSRFELEQAVAE